MSYFFSFHSRSDEYKAYILENVYYTKLLYDRGFNVSPIKDFEGAYLPDFLNVMFNGKVEWGSWVNPALKLSIDLDRFKEDDPDTDDSYYYITLREFLDRHHCPIEIVIDDMVHLQNKLKPKHFDRLMKILNNELIEKPCDEIPPLDDDGYYDLSDFDEEFFPWGALFYGAEWLKDETGNVKGIVLDFIDVPQGLEEPVTIGYSYEAFLTFWDELQKVKKEVANDVHANKNSDRTRSRKGYRTLRPILWSKCENKGNSSRQYSQPNSQVVGL